MTPSAGQGPGPRRPLPINKNLRAISLSLVAKVRARPVVTSTEVANELAREAMAEIASDVSSAELAAVEKNIRRRLYDSLKVLVSVGAITRGRTSKTLRWNGVGHLAPPRRKAPDQEAKRSPVSENSEESSQPSSAEDAPTASNGIVCSPKIASPPPHSAGLSSINTHGNSHHLSESGLDDAGLAGESSIRKSLDAVSDKSEPLNLPRNYREENQNDVTLVDNGEISSTDNGAGALSKELLKAAGALSSARKRINMKTAALRALSVQQQALRSLCERNIRSSCSHSNATKIPLPFVLVRTPDDTDITLESTEDARHIFFNFSDYFQVVNDSGVIDRLFRADTAQMTTIKSSPCGKRELDSTQRGSLVSLSSPNRGNHIFDKASLSCIPGRRGLRSQLYFPAAASPTNIESPRTPLKRQRTKNVEFPGNTVQRRLFLSGAGSRSMKSGCSSPLALACLSPPHAHALSHSSGSCVVSRRTFAPIPSPHWQSPEKMLCSPHVKDERDCGIPIHDEGDIELEHLVDADEDSLPTFEFYDPSNSDDSTPTTRGVEYLDMKF